jgi:branched-chain amino acid aminotransferase
MPSTELDRLIAYFEDGFRPLGQCRIHPLTHAFHYGTGVFEGIRGYWEESGSQVFLFRAEDHYRRWRANARLLDLEPSLTARELCEVTAELVRRNRFRHDVYIRPIIYHSKVGIGVAYGPESRFLIAVLPFSGYLDARHGLKVGVSSWRRISDNAVPSRAKICGAYVNSALASREARRQGFQDAVLLNEAGTVSEGAAFNVFLIRNGRLITPDVTQSILEGITRDTVIKLAARELQLGSEERPVARSELYQAEEVFFTGTAVEIAPVIEIDGRPVGHGRPGKITGELQRLYREVVHGLLPAYASWCYPVFIRKPRSVAT